MTLPSLPKEQWREKGKNKAVVFWGIILKVPKSLWFLLSIHRLSSSNTGKVSRHAPRATRHAPRQRGVDHKSDLPLSLDVCQVTASQ